MRSFALPAETDPDPTISIQPFRIDPFALRGRLVRLGPTIDRILSQHDYPEPVAAMLGEAITLAVVLAGALKYDGVFTLQTKGDGPIRLIVADVSTEGAVRGYAQYDARTARAALARPAASPSVPRADRLRLYRLHGRSGRGHRALPGHRRARPARPSPNAPSIISGNPNRSRPASNCRSAAPGRAARWRAGGLMLQRVPPEGGYAVIADDVEDGWRRAMVLMSSATAAELVDPDLPPQRPAVSPVPRGGRAGLSTRIRSRRAAAARASASRAFCAPSRPTSIEDMRKERGNRRDLRVLQHPLRVHPGRPGAARIYKDPLQLESAARPRAG